MRDFSTVRRIVVKVGTNVLTHGGHVDEHYIALLAAQIASIRSSGREVCLVSSGAIGFGAVELGIAGPVQDVVMRQACAAVGQPILMDAYRRAFNEHNVSIAQVLLTREVLNGRSSYVKLRNAVEKLLDLGIVPVFNENDSVATAEIGTAFGDNDQLSALIASKVDAGLLVLLSDVDAFYDRDPRRSKAAVALDSVTEITDAMIADAGRAGSIRGTGGMKTKLVAVRIAAEGGCRVILADGREAQVLTRLIAGEGIGTLFTARRKLPNKSRWILHSEPQGTIRVDAGAMKAIRNHKSLLPTGITGVDGVFRAGEVVNINDQAKLVSAFASEELRALIGKHSSEITRILGSDDDRTVIARPEDMVFFEDEE